MVAVTIGCVSGNDDCRWPEEQSQRLDLQNPTDVHHLRKDVELAEELSIRYGDVRWAPGPTRQRGREEQCLEPLFDQIAQRHGLSIDDVVGTRASLDHKGANLAVNLPAALFFLFVTWLTLRQIHARFSFDDERLAIVVASVLAALAVGGFTVAFGRMWEGAVDMVRFGNAHLSYRGLRQQWVQFAPALFVLSAVAFSVVAFGVGWWKEWLQHKTAGHAV